LREHLQVIDITDLYLLLGDQVQYIPDAPYALRPDYYCTDIQNRVVLAESKGAIGTRSDITPHLERGQRQVENVVPTSAILREHGSRVVIATHFCVQTRHKRSDTTTIIRDPVGHAGHLKEPSDDLPVRLAYAKYLNHVGLDYLTYLLLNRQPWPTADSAARRELVVSVGGFRFVPLAVSPSGGFMCILEDVYDGMARLVEGGLTEYVNRHLEPLQRARPSLTAGFILSNGIAVFPTIPPDLSMLLRSLICN